MAGIHGHERAQAGRRHDAVRRQLALHRGAIVCRIDHPCAQVDGASSRRWFEHAYVVIGRDGRRRLVRAALRHEVICRRPVGVAIHQCADDAAVHDPGKCLMVCSGHPLGDDIARDQPVGKRPNAQAIRVRWPASKADRERAIAFLETQIGGARHARIVS